MHIVLVSQCEKKAILRTAKVLDAYAVRHGDRTWITPITKNGLDALYLELRSRGTRQTAVSCYVNDGKRRLKLLWVVGRKGTFGLGGAVAVATKEHSQKSQMPALSAAARLACLLAECAGLIHDFGKYGEVFQKKLDSLIPSGDPIRHEWISLQVLLGLFEGKSWTESWCRTRPLRMPEYLTHAHGIGKGLNTVEAVLAFLVMSHHRLPRWQKGGRGSTASPSVPSDGEYFRDDACRPDGSESRANPFLRQPTLLAAKRVEHLLSRIRQYALPDTSPEALRAIASLARMALILADHHVSGIDKTQSEGHGPHLEGLEGAVFANTHKHGGLRLKNQELGWHLTQVGNEAGAMVQRMLSFRPPGLSGDAIVILRKRSGDRFQWQNLCADEIERVQSERFLPTLVINIAGTGSGKTRMNMRAVAALHPPGNDGFQEPLRVAAALNLRTLTLQTRDAYAEQLGLNKEQLACVMGSRIAIQLHDAGKKTAELFDEDENEPEELFDFEGGGVEPPDWLKGFLDKKPVLQPLLMSPVVVSTIDFLINAGEPNKQGNHGLAMLRMMHSDLILDEIDAYDPKAMVAVARLVTASAMWGRHVIASSATLSAPVAKVLYEAFALGVRLYNALHEKQTTWRQVVIDDRVAPLILSSATDVTFIEAFNDHLHLMMASMGNQLFRPAELQNVSRHGGTKDGEKHFFAGVEAACLRLQERHAWAAPKNAAGFTGKISIGLVRVANIRIAIAIARRLATILPHVRVCCYHSQVGLLQRWNIERTLDQILTRKADEWASHTVQNPFVLEALYRAVEKGENRVHFIVIATPVEEIGRDHDFDWAVIEPSSSQSIVQTSGRVNRHRLANVDTPNIAVLQFNYRTCVQQEGVPVFCRPGLESDESFGDDGKSDYGDHDLAKLVNWSTLEKAGQIDARLRYQTQVHPFAGADDRALNVAVQRHMKNFTTSNECAWLIKDTYTNAPLRDKNGATHEEWFIDENGAYFKREPRGRIGWGFEDTPRSPNDIVPTHHNDWLVLSFDETCALAKKHGIAIKAATSVQVLSYGDSGETLMLKDCSFGYSTKRNKA
ncbi:type I-F CRISPR-associated helicase Cas3f [Glaciimonas sp. PAMC28666]|uniref:type I-F CRISPR-associated helicase Cas3f n=1 Tax=Glaciimonas sp. PAMC28666 TaxID=2807626 RepID=UPI001963551A|nr:type I-F CRISPR-associated helicase Cas3f [Glaciimonas sp. PAMC28666]QRX80830.1 type I-F CRISPR-associated helicase Cas3 [Glaciimonas sp. PAMC28666]